ncbi:MAG: tetratricopeptide repeat protein [Deltaproteobacteria bacterium]|nr:tetratricopeptide repeat protein [Deltaproteobacteria bacterium]
MTHSPTTSLQPLAAEHRPARVRLARSLAEAPVRSLVHVDRHGRVRSPARYRVLRAASYLLLGGTLVAGLGLYGSLLGVPGFLLGAALCAWAGWSAGQGSRLEQAVRLLVLDRFDEAEALLRGLVQGRLVPVGLRALALQHLGVVCGRQGRYAEALGHQGQALRLRGRQERWVFAQALRCAQAVTLVNLGRPDDAAAQLQAVGDPPHGDYARLLFDTAGLYVAMAQGRVPLPEVRLHEQTRHALGITGAAALLGLCAWAWRVLGDVEQSRLCLREAFDRADGLHLPRSMPVLYRWMHAHAADAGVPADGMELPA